MSKLAAVLAIAAALVTISIILCPSEARPITTTTTTTSSATSLDLDKTAHHLVVSGTVVHEDVCEGEEDCQLIRRTLEAHTDYIYTGETKP